MPPTEGSGQSIRQRAAEAASAPTPAVPPSSAVDPQEGLFDQTWDNEDLLMALEEREVTRAAKITANKDHKLKDDQVKALLANYRLAVGEVARIGRFRIKKTERKGNSISFETAPREQLTIEADSA